jgi:hypothetical protein
MHRARLPHETFRFSALLGMICMINPDMLQLASALLIGLLGLQWVKFLLARGIVLSSRRERRELNAKQPPLHRGGTRREQQPRCQHAKQEREAKWWRDGPREWATQSEENDWWRVLEVSPYASADHIRRSYLRKIKESHPDRVAWLAPGFLQLAERRAKMLNAAYADATRARRGSNGRKGTGA